MAPTQHGVWQKLDGLNNNDFLQFYIALFHLDVILFGFLLLTSSSVFKSVAVPAGRNSIATPSPSPVR
jgi:hypothetical protein